MMSGGRSHLRDTATSPWRSLGALALFVVAALTVLPTTILVLVAVVPMVVTRIVDQSPGRYLARTVSGMATAAVIPFVATLWGGGHTLRLAMSLVTDVYTWFAIYAAVGVGWLMFLGFPSLAGQLRVYNGQRRIARLKKLQQELVAEWGPSIAETILPQVARPPAAAAANATPSRRAPTAPG